MTSNVEPNSNAPSSFEEVLVGYLEAVESGSGPSEKELCERFPNLADELREYIEAEQNLVANGRPHGRGAVH